MWRAIQSHTTGGNPELSTEKRRVSTYITTTRILKTETRENPDEKEYTIGSAWASAMGASRPRHRPTICYRTSNYDCGTIRADPTPDMDIRNSFSRLKKKVKRMRSKQRPGGTGADADGERVDPDNPCPRPEPHVAVNKADGDRQQAGATYQPPQQDKAELVPANWSENSHGGGEADVNGRKVGPTHPHPRPDTEIGTGNRPRQQGNGVDREGGGQFYSYPSVSHGGEPEGVLTCLFRLLPSSFTQTT